MRLEDDDFAALLTRKEPLREELRDYVETVTKSGLAMLRHPLIVSIYSEAQNALFNRQYEVRSRALLEAEHDGAWERGVLLHERPYRLRAFLGYSSRMTDADYWRLLSWVWTDSENIWQGFDAWMVLWASSRPGRARVMDDVELDALLALPPTITIYRGTQRGRRLGLSWTLDRERARWFARRYSPARPLVVTGVASARSVWAHFKGRGEEEIVISPRRVRVTDKEEAV